MIEQCVCEKIIADNFNGIQAISVPFPDLELLLIASEDGVIRLYDVRKKSVLSQFEVKNHNWNKFLLVKRRNSHEKSCFLLTPSSPDNSLKVWNISIDLPTGTAKINSLLLNSKGFEIFGENQRKIFFCNSEKAQFRLGIYNDTSRNLVTYDLSAAEEKE